MTAIARTAPGYWDAFAPALSAYGVTLSQGEWNTFGCGGPVVALSYLPTWETNRYGPLSAAQRDRQNNRIPLLTVVDHIPPNQVLTDAQIRSFGPYKATDVTTMADLLDARVVDSWRWLPIYSGPITHGYPCDDLALWANDSLRVGRIFSAVPAYWFPADPLQRLCELLERRVLNSPWSTLRDLSYRWQEAMISPEEIFMWAHFPDRLTAENKAYLDTLLMDANYFDVDDAQTDVRIVEELLDTQGMRWLKKPDVYGNLLKIPRRLHIEPLADLLLEDPEAGRVFSRFIEIVRPRLRSHLQIAREDPREAPWLDLTEGVLD